MVELTILSANAENKTFSDIENDIKKGFDSLKDQDLTNLVTTEGMFFLNKGRAYIAKEQIK